MIKSGLSALYKMLGAALTAQYILRAQGMPFRISAPPEDPRYWHDPTNDRQASVRIGAEHRRQVRAEKLKLQTLGAWNNAAHVVTHPAPEGSTYRAFVPTLNPFYVAK